MNSVRKLLQVQHDKGEPPRTPEAERVTARSTGLVEPGLDDQEYDSAHSSARPTGLLLDERDAGQPEPRLMLPRIRLDAFVQADDLVNSINAVARDRRAVRSEFGLHPGGFAEALNLYRAHSPADMLIIEHSGSTRDLDQSIEALAELCPPTTRLIVIGESNDVGLYRRIIKSGASDYLVRPVDPLNLLDSILSIFAEGEDSKRLGLVLAFVGARGGTGSSTVAHNVSVALNKSYEATTLLIDADVGFGTSSLQFDVSPPHCFGDAAKERGDLNPEVLEKLTHWRNKRFGILTSSCRPEQMTPPDPGATRHIVDQARRLAQYVVLDLPHGWTPWTGEALGAADRVGLVATADLPSLRNTGTLLEMIRRARPNDEPPYLVLNRVNRRPQVSLDDFTRVLERRISAIIPFDDAAAVAEMTGRVLVEAVKPSAAGSAIEALAVLMSGREPVASKSRSRKGPFAGFLRWSSK